MALTATATHNVRKDILKILRIPRALVLEVGLDPRNLTYEVLKNRCETLRSSWLTSSRVGSTRIVGSFIASHRRNAWRCPVISSKHPRLKAAYYHAGVPSRQRVWVQQSWQRGEVQVICATIAFGMVINQADVVSPSSGHTVLQPLLLDVLPNHTSLS